MIKSLIKRVLHLEVSFSWIASKWDIVFGVRGRSLRFRATKKWHMNSYGKRVGYLALAMLMSVTLLTESLAFYGNVGAISRITSDVDRLLIEAIPSYGNFLEYDSDSQQFEYNQGYKATGSVFGTKSAPKFSATFPLDGNEGTNVIDPSTGTSIKITPKFSVGLGQRDLNRIVYPLPGRDAVKVISLGGVGYKEDIVLNTFQGGSLSFEYELELPSGTEARLENDGSVAFYGVRTELLGNVSTGSEEDAALLEKALLNGEKTNLLFKMPAPYVIETGRQESLVDSRFELDGNRLITRVSNLRNANYPLTIDPSVYVETARKFMRGNNETNTDFDIDSELIQKASTTGARFNSWTSTQALNDGRFDGGTAVAGGYVYQVGGGSGSVGTPTIIYSSSGTTAFVVPAGVTSITVEMWGAGGGGGGGSSNGSGGDGGGGAYSTAELTTTPGESLDVRVGGGGGGGTGSGNSGGAGGGGGHSEVERAGTSLLIAAAGGGGGGGDNSSGTSGGAGGAGGDDTGGIDGGDSSSAGGGVAATSGAGGAGGTGGNTSGAAGSAETGGPGGNGGVSQGTGGENNGGFNNGDGDGGNQATNFYGAGGGGGSGRFGGGGGSGALAGFAGGGGGGSGSSFLTGASTSSQSGSGTTPGNPGDGDRGGAADGGGGNSGTGNGTAGDDGIVIISYTAGLSNTIEASVYWANINQTDGTIDSPNPGDGACTDWCTDAAYDLPEARRGFSLVAYNGFLYAIGGEDDMGNREATVYIAKLGANGEPSLWHPTNSDPNTWEYWYADTELSEGVSYTAAVAYNNRMYLLGGSTDLSTGGVTTSRYTEIEPTGTLANWTTTGVLAMSTARFQFSVEVYNDNLYVIGGDSSSSGNLLNTVEQVKLNVDGTFLGSWETVSSFTTARRTNGGDYTAIYGAYMYIAGGCTSVSSGNCQTVGSDIQIASIFADGSLGEWSDMSNETNERVGYGLIAWQNNIYRVGGCTSVVTTSSECGLSLSTVDFGEINPPGEVSTVNISTANGVGDCSGGTPFNCDLPPAGDDAGEGGQMLSISIAVNGFLYVIGGCVDYTCSGSNPQPTSVSGNVSYTEIGIDGTLGRPSTCIDSYYGAWCVDNTNRINGTTGVAAGAVAVFDNTIYIVGGLNGSGNTNRIFRNTVNTDGSLSGGRTQQTMTAIGASNVAYTYAYARANPSEAGSNPANLYIFGGCSSTSGAGCSGSYITNVYKCNIGTSGAISGCTTSGQLQIDSTPGTGGNDGLGIHSGTVYANYVYLIGGYSAAEADKDDVLYAQIDDSNNIVAVSGTDWIESPEKLSIGRRRGWAFGYNGHVYAVGGFDSGEGVLPFIEWSKLNVSDGSIDPFVTSTVTINQRWGLSMIVSNSFAYVIGGCDAGDSPGDCSSFEPSVQTFQLYNNDSGAQADFTESAGNFATNNDRIGSSAAILDGYIYVAGGETSSVVTTDSSRVQFATLNPNGTIGTWADTTATLPAARAYGQLEVAGGSLYYLGGEDTAGDEKSDVYYATPASGAATDDVVKSTSYKISNTEFTGTTYTLTLNNNLESDYFVMVAGGDSSGNTSGPDSSQVRVDGDPFGNLTATTSANQIRLERGIADDNWVGSVTVVECSSACATDGFQLSEVLDVSLAASNVSTDVTLAAAHSSRTVPFGGYLGGGLSTTTTSNNNFSATAGVRIMRNSTNQIRIERQTGGSAGTAAAADLTVYVVEWGTNWNVEQFNVENWTAGGQGVDIAAEYTEQGLVGTYTRDNTWVWKSPGNSEDNGLGDGSFGKVVTLGNGETEGPSENSIALGSEPNAPADIKDDTVYIMEHADLAVDYEFNVRSNMGTSFTDTVTAAIEPETVATIGNITSSEGYRIPLFYYTDNGTGTAYSRVAGWSNYFSNDTTISYAKSFSGNNQAGWIQSVDFGNNAGTSGSADISSWATASGGIGDTDSQAAQDRTRFSASVWNDRIYVVGGLDNSATETQTVFISPQLSAGGDIAADSWSSGGDLPDVERSGATLIAYANNLYYLGGNDGTNYLSDVQFATIGYKTGTIAQSGATLTGTGTTWASSMVGSTIQYTDGTNATVTAFSSTTSLTVDVSKTVVAGASYSIQDGSVGPWTFTTSLPQYISDADGFAANGFIYLFGGRSAVGTCTNNSYVAPISANTTIATGNNPTGVGEWYQTNVEFAGDRYSAGVAYNEGKVYVTGGGCGTELATDQHYVGTLRSQPQLARYSYYVDADSDVFPDAWLLNGLDNDIGARWQFAYRSSTNIANAWGVDTVFGDTTLGRVETYTAYDDLGVDTDFARYFYVTISIDASQTFGYPDDVSRGPTIDDMTLFFVADPNKRLRHGKTFIQGVEQPLDTPCRVSGANPSGSQPNCPQP